MEMSRRIISMLLAAVLLVLLCACGGGGASDSVESGDPEPSETVKLPTIGAASAPKSLTDGVILGRSVFIDEDNNVAFWRANETLCSGLVDLSGQIYDYYAEGEFPISLWSIAIRGDDCVLGASEGMFLMSLSAFGQGVNQMMKLNMHGVYDGFSILDDYIYYQADEELYRAAFTGDGETRMTSGVFDFELTSDGIYYTSVDGGLYRIGPDGGDRTKLADTGDETHLFARSSDLLCWAAGENCVYLWDVEENAAREIALDDTLAENECVWPVGEDAFIYTDDDDEVHRCTISEGSDVVVDELSVLPDKGNGCLLNDVLYYCYADTVYWDDLLTCQKGSAELGGDFPEASGGTSAPQEGGTQPPAAGGTFDISSNIQFQASQGYTLLINDYFSVCLPMLPEWEVEVIDDETLSFIYPPAAEAGFGGQFLTIKAFDLDDYSYEDFPAWSLAGVDSQKQYVAIFPTDVRYDPDSDTQMEEFNILYSAAREIDASAAYNPFVIAGQGL